VPQAIVCVLEASDFEDAIRNSISIGGDSDTIGCIAGGIAEALFGIPKEMREKGMSYLPVELKQVVEEFELKYGKR
jgi:ADP-ribosylglycohydrolase